MGKQADAVSKKAKKPEIEEEENAEPVKKQKVANGDGNKVAKNQQKLAPKAEAKVSKKAAPPSESEEESDEAPAPPVKKGKAPAKPVKQDSDDEEEEAPKAKAKPAAGKKPVAKPADDDEEEAPAKKGGFTEGEHEIFVRGLSYDADEDALRELFAECGDIKSINLLKNNMTGRSKGLAFIKFEAADGLEAAVALNGTEHMGRTLEIEKSRPKGDRPPRPERGGGADGESNTIFVGNLSFQSTEDSIYEFFGAHGEVKAVRIAKQPDGKMKGFAHVEFADASSAADAVSKNGSELDGRQIKVDLAGKRPPGGGGGFGGGRGGGFGGGRGGGFRGGRGGGRGGGRW